ncbi:hypothetical protein ABT294_32390 [Nonomuraea sp. NPDC000554]|uniref:hypothetical protein n=1 Tax=Nonomuraea sp. NPDC000554 TaxID=3154259 RepID=UPI003319D3EC
MSSTTLRKIAGYGAALTLSLYLAVKIIWVTAELIRGTSDWLALNALTVVMAGVGVTLALALAQRWGLRLPALPVVFFAWVGYGFLVPMIPYMAAASLLAPNVETSDATPLWEMVLISVGFAGMALGLAVGLPLYLRERWPDAFAGRLGGRRSPALAGAVLAGAAVLAVLWLGWALGGTALTRHPLDLNARLMLGTTGVWTLAGAWSAWALGLRRTGMRKWPAVALGFTVSGMLFAWSGWKLAMALLGPGGYVPPEYPVVAVAEHAVGVLAGAGLFALVLRAARPRAYLVRRSGPSLPV